MNFFLFYVLVFYWGKTLGYLSRCHQVWVWQSWWIFAEFRNFEPLYWLNKVTEILAVSAVSKKIKEKNCKNSGRDDQNFGHFVQPVQWFKVSKFRENSPTLSCNISWQVHAIGIIYMSFVERSKSFLNHAHTLSHLLWYARQSWKMLKLVHFSRQIIKANSASSKQISDKIFDNFKKFATVLRMFFTKSVFLVCIYLQNWSKNAKLDGETFFC